MAQIYGFDISRPAKNAKRSNPVDVLWILSSNQKLRMELP